MQKNQYDVAAYIWPAYTGTNPARAFSGRRAWANGSR